MMVFQKMEPTFEKSLQTWEMVTVVKELTRVLI